MRRTKIIAALTALSMFLAIPAQAATTTYYMNGYTCLDGKKVGIRLTNRSNATLDKVQFQIGVSSNPWSLFPGANWSYTNYPALPDDQSKNYYTGYAKVWSEQQFGTPSWTKVTISEFWSAVADAYYFCY